MNWMAKFISYDKNGIGILCGATVIDKYWLLTAAHCAAEMKQKSFVIVSRSPNDELTISVLEAIIHPRYNNRTAYNDIALLKVSTNLLEKGVQPICLIQDEQELILNYKNGIVVGFGASFGVNPGTITLKSSPYLQETTVPIIPLESCRSTWQILSYRTVKISSNQLCAGSYLHGTAPGDSGGPLLIEKFDGTFIQVGITSFGADGLEGLIDQGKYPGVYTRVSQYIPWIESVTSTSSKIRLFLIIEFTSIFFLFYL